MDATQATAAVVQQKRATIFVPGFGGAATASRSPMGGAPSAASDEQIARERHRIFPKAYLERVRQQLGVDSSAPVDFTTEPADGGWTLIGTLPEAAEQQAARTTRSAKVWRAGSEGVFAEPDFQDIANRLGMPRNQVAFGTGLDVIDGMPGCWLIGNTTA
jgi:hypothetical protein